MNPPADSATLPSVAGCEPGAAFPVDAELEAFRTRCFWWVAAGVALRDSAARAVAARPTDLRRPRGHEAGRPALIPMPLTVFQRGVLRLLAAHRGPESFVAGGLAINAGPDSPRYSEDVDIFHDAQEHVAVACAADVETLGRWRASRWRGRSACRVFSARSPRCGAQSLRLEWAQDSAFRFFPGPAGRGTGLAAAPGRPRHQQAAGLGGPLGGARLRGHALLGRNLCSARPAGLGRRREGPRPDPRLHPGAG